MATNKRKEAAALFELIDKSTLKVPKNAGALKIPSWWSSKSNPPANGEGDPVQGTMNGRTAAPTAPAPTASPAVEQPKTPSQSRTVPPATQPATAARQPEVAGARPEARNGTPISPAPAGASPPSAAPATPNDISAQQRLFDPPPAHAHMPPPTPSIRPPAPQIAAPVSPPVKAPPPPPPPPAMAAPITAPAPAPVTPVATEVVVAEAESKTMPVVTEPIAEEELPPEPEAPAAPATASGKTFAPQTHAQPGRKPWTPPRVGGQGIGAGVLARVPTWALLAAAAGVVLVIFLLVVVIRGGFGAKESSGGSPTGGPTAANPGGTTGGPVGGGLIPRPGGDPSRNTTGQPGLQQQPVQTGSRLAQGTPNVPGPADPTPANRGQARVYQPGEAQRTGDLQYLIIAQTPDLKIAQRNATALAAAGIDVSIEHMKGGLYGLVSVQGFRTSAEGESLRRKVIEVGRQFPGKGWGDAYFTPVRRPAAQG